MREFGCLCYPLLLSHPPHKLAPKSCSCVFLGYAANKKGYQCVDRTTCRGIASCYVQFDKDACPFHASSSVVLASQSNHPAASFPFLELCIIRPPTSIAPTAPWDVPPLQFPSSYPTLGVVRTMFVKFSVASSQIYMSASVHSPTPTSSFVDVLSSSDPSIA